MSDFELPVELLTKCRMIIEKANTPRAVLDRMTTDENMGVLLVLPQSMILLKGQWAAFKLRIACWIAGVGTLGAAWAFSNYWLLLLLAAVVILDRRFAAQDRKCSIGNASVILALDVLAEDFGGWGAAYPKQREHALSFLQLSFLPPESRPKLSRASFGLLDFYLPDCRTRSDPVALKFIKSFGPGGESPVVAE